MYFYQGYSCPVCEQLFTESDDVVVCPQCGLPHHRDCWNKTGHCFLEHLHNTEQQWSRDRSTPPSGNHSHDTHTDDNAVPHHQFCPRCGTKNPEFAEFCQHCGLELVKDNHAHQAPHYSEYQPFRHTHSEVDSNETFDEVKASDLVAVVGQKSEYYLPRFRRISRQGGNAGWNWAAFFFGPLWLLYRKMYAYGAIFILLELLHTAVTEFAMQSLGLSEIQSYSQLIEQFSATPLTAQSTYFFAALGLISIVMFALSILLAVYGNRLYYEHCRKSIKRARTKTPDLTSGEIATIGGTSILIAFIGYVTQYFLTQILLLFII